MNPADFSDVAGAVLAAGFGRRFGHPKLLLPVGGRPLVSWPVEAALEAGLGKVFLVTGSQGAEMGRALPKDPRLEIITNPQPQKGMGGSLALAARRARECGALALVVLLGDMPMVQSETISRVAKAALDAPSGAAAAQAGGRRIHPVAFAHRHLARLAQLDKDVGGREVLKDIEEGLTLVPAPELSALDVDTPQDLARVRRLFSSKVT